MAENNRFVLLGAGLPRTGTTSTREALMKLLKGDVYHMKTVIDERPDQHPLWRKALDKTASSADWHSILDGYKAGVDYPVSFFYKEIMEVYPNAKVLLNVRDPVKWYESVKNSIYRMQKTFEKFPVSWFMAMVGRRNTMKLCWEMCVPVPECSSTGLSIFGAVEAGQEAAVQFYHDHVNEVKSVVPADRLLVWEAKEGWGPLCKFLGVPEPNEPFPRVNDTAEMDGNRKRVLCISWLLVCIIPALVVLSAWFFNWYTPAPLLTLVGGYTAVVGILRLRMGRLLGIKKPKID